MGDKIEVKHVPVQRNVLDVATDLTLAYTATYGIGSVEEMQQVFLKFYAVAQHAWNAGRTEMAKYLPE